MAKLELAESIERPVADVFRFVGTEHVTNHPSWDPEMTLVQETPGPIGVGTRIHRLRMRDDSRIEGEMEIIEYEPDRTLGAVIRDGPVQLHSWMRVESQGDRASRLTITVESDDAPVSMMEEPIRGSLRRIKELVERRRKAPPGAGDALAKHQANLRLQTGGHEQHASNAAGSADHGPLVLPCVHGLPIRHRGP